MYLQLHNHVEMRLQQVLYVADLGPGVSRTVTRSITIKLKWFNLRRARPTQDKIVYFD